ncbi:F-box/kelch-repeat protein At3g23880-like isoform X1 [Vicia villosa]|uniref:F-box/kelch-repeat protein At3g23880-like isoform X1 n=1 Tax=Vicia villosa TaxID=3911 RepID=UPI00273C9EA9|nr:F-box/kelch-repeat protein At3g23880-like isoform X1 [Vicia villosa]
MNSPPAKSPHLNGAPPSVLLDELISQILSLLPVKTLMQMKCVCKLWKTLISDSAFAKLHLQRSPRNTHLLLIQNWSNPDEALDCSVEPFPVTNLLEVRFSPFYTYREINAIPDDPHYRLKNLDCWEVVGSCNGLLCLRGSSWAPKNHTTWLRLWNPATNTLSEKLGYQTNFYCRFTFGYDISTDSYKAVAFSANKVKVFRFGDNVWRNIECFPVVPFDVEATRLSCHPFVYNGVYVSGAINWLAIRNKIEYEWKDITVDQFVIVSLDLATETYRELLPPQGFVEVPPVEPSVTVLMDCLCFSHRSKGTHFVLWKMMEFGVQESWTQFLKISFQNLRIDHGISDSLAYDSQLFLLPLCSCERSNTLIMATNEQGDVFSNQRAILFNWKHNRVDLVTSFYNDILWFFTKGYVESLVSTCPRTTPSTSSTYGALEG